MPELSKSTFGRIVLVRSFELAWKLFHVGNDEKMGKVSIPIFVVEIFRVFKRLRRILCTSSRAGSRFVSKSVPEGRQYHFVDFFEKFNVECCVTRRDDENRSDTTAEYDLNSIWLIRHCDHLFFRREKHMESPSRKNIKQKTTAESWIVYESCIYVRTLSKRMQFQSCVSLIRRIRNSFSTFPWSIRRDLTEEKTFSQTLSVYFILHAA